MIKHEKDTTSSKLPTADFPARTFSPALILPLKDNVHTKSPFPRVLAILHAYHTDVAEKMIRRLASLNVEEEYLPLKLVITTDTAAKARKIEAVIARWVSCLPMGYAINVHPNRGRNVAPFLASCKVHAHDNDVILHLHTKRSPHAPELAGWGEYLFDCLAGSRDLLRSVLRVLEDRKIGLLYPAHYRSIANHIEWGPNLHLTHEMLRRLGVNIPPSTRLDFPSGMMFWTRLGALRPLLDLNLLFSDFEVEAGQTDGTLAHAIERAMIYIVEKSGHFSQSLLWDRRVDDYWGDGIRVTANEVPNLVDRSRLLAKQV